MSRQVEARAETLHPEPSAIKILGAEHFPDFSVPPAELVAIAEGEGRKLYRLEEVALARVNPYGFAISTPHVSRLAISIKEVGLLEPVELFARPGESGITSDIANGFHRTHALLRNRAVFAPTVVVYGADRKDLFDVRIICQNTLDIRTSRLYTWIGQAYDASGWKDKIRLPQALDLLDGSKGEFFGLTSQEIEELKAWILSKSRLWGISLFDLRRYADVVDKVHQTLVGRVRDRKGPGVITPRVAEKASEVIPDDGHKQEVLGDLVEQQHLTEPQAAKVAEALAEARSDGDVTGVIETDWKAEFRQKIRTGEQARRELGKHYIDLIESDPLVADLKAEIERLKTRVDILSGGPWWRTATFLAEEERKVLELFLVGAEDVDTIVMQLGLRSGNHFLQLFRSAHRKLMLAQEEI